MLQEFKKFILKGNVIDLSTGVIIGAAFSKIVDAFTAGVIKPVLDSSGGSSGVGLKIWVFDIGMIVTAIINFLITAAVIFFVIIKPYNLLAARLKKEEPAALPPAPSSTDKLLMEIRDALKR